MTRSMTWVLTDTFHDVWLDNFSTGAETTTLPKAHGWSVRKRTLRGGPREGVDLVEVDNGKLSYAILPTRGMSLWRGDYSGLPLGWRSPIPGPIHPHHVNLTEKGGLGWLYGFDELLVRCGLNTNGPPGVDEETGPFTLHGRIANLAAHRVEVRVNLEPPHEISVTGQVDESGLFCGHLRLTATYTTIPGSNRVVIHDVVENLSSQAAELQLLYHCNLGPPFLEAGSRLLAPIQELAPFTERAAEDIDTYERYVGPTPGYTEQVYAYQLLSDDTQQTLALLSDSTGERGCCLRFNQSELPCFTLWKNCLPVEDGYVTGLEPGINYPNFKSFEREQGRAPKIAPGGRWETSWSLEVVDSKAGVDNVLEEIATLQAQSPAKIHRKPQSKFSMSAPK